MHKNFSSKTSSFPYNITWQYHCFGKAVQDTLQLQLRLGLKNVILKFYCTYHCELMEEYTPPSCVTIDKYVKINRSRIVNVELQLIWKPVNIYFKILTLFLLPFYYIHQWHFPAPTHLWRKGEFNFLLTKNSNPSALWLNSEIVIFHWSILNCIYLNLLQR